VGISSALGSSALLPAGLGFRNLLINGGMAIDQRNSGASVTVNSTSNFYGPDQWQGFGQLSDGTFTLQRISATPTPPAGFTYALKVATGTTDTSIGATQSYGLANKMEGFNTAQLGWGASGAKQAVLSFWVYGSKAGTYGGSLSNSAFDRSFPFSYTINAINTWEYKTVYITGDTSGTWLKDNGIGIRLVFSVGAGADRITTPGAWASGRYEGATGQTNLIATSDSLVFTGVQLEQNYQPTPFEQRPYGVELQLCQRYYEKSYLPNTVPGSDAYAGCIQSSGAGNTDTTSYIGHPIRYVVTKRAIPTLTVYDRLGASGKVSRDNIAVSGSNGNTVSESDVYSSPNGAWIYSASGIAADYIFFQYVAVAEL